jgi:hypothetical protein
MEPAGTLNKEGGAGLSVFCAVKLYAEKRVSETGEISGVRRGEREGRESELFVGIR